ncbi:MAG: hypothetical protein RSB61_05605 [Clostridia bacterium]
MPKYIKCPRCELNWITPDQELCDVCKAELRIGGIELLEEEDETLCPICHLNYLESGEKICSECREKKLDKVAVAPFEESEETTASPHAEEGEIEIVSFDDVEREEEAWADDLDAPIDEEVFAIDDLDEDLIVGDLEGEEEEEEEVVAPVHDAVEEDFDSVIDELANAPFIDDEDDDDEKEKTDEDDDV